METDSLHAIHGPPASANRRCGYYKCAVAMAAVMGFIIAALMGGFIIHFFMCMSSCNQDVGTTNHAAKVNITCTLKTLEGNERGRYDIFTVDKAATYFIYGWITFLNITGEEVFLRQRWNKTEMILKKETQNAHYIFVYDKATLVNNSTVSIDFKSTFTGSSFHVCEL